METSGETEIANDNRSSLVADLQSAPTEIIIVHDILSNELADEILSSISCYVLPAIFALGIVGNTLTLFVLSAQGVAENSNVVLFCLTVSDLAHVLTYFASRLFYLVGHVDLVAKEKMKPFSYAVLDMIVFTFGRMSAMFVCLVAVERFVVIVFPLRAATVLTKYRIRFVCALTYALTMMAVTPSFLYVRIVYEFDPKFNQSMPSYQFTTFYHDNFAFLYWYSSIGLGLVFRITPLAVVTVVTISIIVVLKRFRQWRHVMPSGHNEKRELGERRVTKMMVSVCVAYIAFSFPALVFYLLYGTYPEFSIKGKYSNLVQVVISVLAAFEMINSSVNFLLYLVTSARFVRIFKRLIRSNLSNSTRVSSGG